MEGKEEEKEMKLVYMRDSRSRGYITLGISFGEEKRSFTVSETDYSDIGEPRIGDEISSLTFSLIKDSDEAYRARLYALRILSYADNNEMALARKLIMKKISPDIAKRVASEMVSLGYIKEEDQLRRAIIKEANQSLKGPRLIRAKLRAKGFSSGDIDLQLDSLIASGEVDFKVSADRLVEKKLARGASDEEIKMLLYKNGYDIC